MRESGGKNEARDCTQDSMEVNPYYLTIEQVTREWFFAVSLGEAWRPFQWNSCS
jgi:hypothetical protein